MTLFTKVGLTKKAHTGHTKGMRQFGSFHVWALNFQANWRSIPSTELALIEAQTKPF